MLPTKILQIGTNCELFSNVISTIFGIFSKGSTKKWNIFISMWSNQKFVLIMNVIIRSVKRCIEVWNYFIPKPPSKMINLPKEKIVFINKLKCNQKSFVAICKSFWLLLSETLNIFRVFSKRFFQLPLFCTLHELQNVNLRERIAYE